METTDPTETLPSSTTPSLTRSRHLSGGKMKNVDFSLPESAIPQHLLNPELAGTTPANDNAQPVGTIPRDKRSHSPMFGRRRRKSSRDVDTMVDVGAAKVNGLHSITAHDLEQCGENVEATAQKKSFKTLLFGRHRVASKPGTTSDLPDVGALLILTADGSTVQDGVSNGEPQVSEKTEATPTSTTSGAQHKSLFDRFKSKKVDAVKAGVNHFPIVSGVNQMPEEEMAATADANESESSDLSSVPNKSTLRRRFGRNKTSREEVRMLNETGLPQLQHLNQVLPSLQSKVESDLSSAVFAVVPSLELPLDGIEHASGNLKRSKSKRALFMDKMQAKMAEQKQAMQSAIEKVNDNISGTIDDIKATQQRLKVEFEAENQRIIGSVKDRIKKDLESVGDFKNVIKRELKEVINTIKKEIVAIVNGILWKIFMVIAMVALCFLFAIIGLIWTIRTVANGEDRMPPVDEVAQSFLRQQTLEFEQMALKQVRQRISYTLGALYCGHPYPTNDNFCTALDPLVVVQ